MAASTIESLPKRAARACGRVMGLAIGQPIGKHSEEATPPREAKIHRTLDPAISSHARPLATGETAALGGARLRATSHHRRVSARDHGVEAASGQLSGTTVRRARGARKRPSVS